MMMKPFLSKLCIGIFLLGIFSLNVSAQKETVSNDDRQYWVDLLYRTAAPILENMSKGELKKNMDVELSPTWIKGRNTNVVYLEAFGRLMAGIAPWLALPDDNTKEGKLRKKMRGWALKSYKNAVDPNSKDYLLWKGENQILCDAAYLVNSFMRAPQALWQPLDQETKQRYIEILKSLRSIRPAYNNWLLFRGMVETFLISIGESYDGYAVEVALQKMNEWYLGDGWYSDGPEYSLDYYNGYVMHPMYVEMLEVVEKKRINSPVKLELALRRMQRYNVLLERLISPEAAYPAMGRSMTYRMGAFQTLALAAWKFELPKQLSNGQVRSALTAVMKRMFANTENFTPNGYLQLGFVGHQPNIADYYTNNGSLYMTSLVFLPLGLPADHPFWTDPAQPWTSQKAWDGVPFPKDYHQSIKR